MQRLHHGLGVEMNRILLGVGIVCGMIVVAYMIAVIVWWVMQCP